MTLHNRLREIERQLRNIIIESHDMGLHDYHVFRFDVPLIPTLRGQLRQRHHLMRKISKYLRRVDVRISDPVVREAIYYFAHKYYAAAYKSVAYSINRFANIISDALFEIAPDLDVDQSMQKFHMTVDAMYDEVYEIILEEIQSPDYDIGEVLKRIFKKVGITLVDLKADKVSTLINELYDVILTVTRGYVRSSIDRFLEESQRGTPKREDYQLNQDLFVEVISILDDLDLIDAAEPEDFYGFCVIVQRLQRRSRLGRVKKIRNAFSTPGEKTSNPIYNFIHSVLELRGD